MQPIDEKDVQLAIARLERIRADAENALVSLRTVLHRQSASEEKEVRV